MSITPKRAPVLHELRQLLLGTEVRQLRDLDLSWPALTTFLDRALAAMSADERLACLRRALGAYDAAWRAGHGERDRLLRSLEAALGRDFLEAPQVMELPDSLRITLGIVD